MLANRRKLSEGREITVGRRQTAGTPLVIRLASRRLWIFWFCLINYWASKWVDRMAFGLPGELSSRKKFRSKNFALQEQFQQIFAPFHHLCPECNSCCTPHEEIPCSALDSILYGSYPASVLVHELISLKKLLTAYLWDNALIVRRYLRERTLRKIDNPQGKEILQEQGLPCPAMTEKGCDLPLGGRPIFCVFFICGPFIREMNWREYRHYVWVSGKYLLQLTLSLKLVVAEWHQKQRMPA